MLLFRNARLIDPASGHDEIGHLITENGYIRDIGSDINIPAEFDGTDHHTHRIIDCKGAILSPGLVDMRAHAVDAPAALKGGITTLILQPNQTSCIDNDAAVERIMARAVASANLRIYPMGAATKGLKGNELSEIGQMQASGAIGFTDCRAPVSDARLMRRLLEYAGYFKALIVQFAEDPSLAAGGYAHEGETATRLGLNSIPSVAEVIQIERDIKLVTLTGTPLHIALLSTAEGVEAVRRAKQKGIPVSASTSPAYLHFNDNAIEGYRSFAKLSPPLRTEEDRLALIKGLADGTIDTLVSDHDPKSEDVKRLPFAQAQFGAVGFETLLAAGLSLVARNQISLHRLLDALSSRPSTLLGLKGGKLEKDAPADLVLFDPDKPWIVDRHSLLSSATNTPFDTLPLMGKVLKTCVAGTIQYELKT